MSLENAISQISDKMSEKIEGIKSATGWKKAGRILMICGFIIVALIPFFIYFMFFAKENTIDVKVKGEVKDIENKDGGIDKDALKSGNKKANKILKKVK